MVAALRWSVRWAAAGGAAILVCGAIFLLVSGTGHTRRRLGGEQQHGDERQGGPGQRRDRRWRGDRPVWGWGSGSFGAAFSRHIERAKTTVSHTEPITVAAEQGGIGLIVYLALVVARPDRPVQRGERARWRRAATAACFVAMVVHSLGYAAFTIDPATWALLGLGVALGGPGRRVGGRRRCRRRLGHPRSPRDPRPAAV